MLELNCHNNSLSHFVLKLNIVASREPAISLKSISNIYVVALQLLVLLGIPPRHTHVFLLILQLMMMSTCFKYTCEMQHGDFRITNGTTMYEKHAKHAVHFC